MRQLHQIAFGKRRGIILLPETEIALYLNPVECTLYRIFLAHPEGIASDDLMGYWKELCDIYSRESRFDDKPLRDNTMEALCAESKTCFYTNISRIKKKFVALIGARKASPYIIKRGKDGLYRTKATLR